jgi:hypothetical protein
MIIMLDNTNKFFFFFFNIYTIFKYIFFNFENILKTIEKIFDIIMFNLIIKKYTVYTKFIEKMIINVH